MSNAFLQAFVLRSSAGNNFYSLTMKLSVVNHSADHCFENVFPQKLFCCETSVIFIVNEHIYSINIKIEAPTCAESSHFERQKDKTVWTGKPIKCSGKKTLYVHSEKRTMFFHCEVTVLASLIGWHQWMNENLLNRVVVNKSQYVYIIKMNHLH